jgi:ubiquinone/menaquinone biosynthesis C-methylase UbiE
MKESFWDRVAPDYDAEIFNTLKSDRNGRLGDRIKHLAQGSQLACDFGCGVGRFLSLLHSCCDSLVATDFSAASLEIAKKQLGSVELKGTRFLKRDLTKLGRKFCSANFGLLINVLIMPKAEHRDAILKNVRTNLNKGARLVVVTPSLENVMYTYSRLLEWNLREGKSRRSAENEVNREAATEFDSIAGGIVRIHDTPTKHYLAEELELHLQKHKFKVLERTKVEYEWTEDFEEAPQWLKSPYPWDWLIVAEKV